MTLSAAELERFVAGLAARPDLRAGPGERSDHARTYRQIWDDGLVNAWLIYWGEDADTGFHDHDDSAAAIEVIAGHVREDRLRLDGPPGGRVLGPGARLSLPANAIHRVRHVGPGPAITVHAYSPPLRRTGAYTVSGEGTLERTAQPYDTELRRDVAADGGRAADPAGLPVAAGRR